MTNSNEITWIETVDELNTLDWEVPYMPAYNEADEDNADNIVAAFEAHNGIRLDVDALRAFKNAIEDVYDTK
jgi:hypothetical protein